MIFSFLLVWVKHEKAPMKMTIRHIHRCFSLLSIGSILLLSILLPDNTLLLFPEKQD